MVTTMYKQTTTSIAVHLNEESPIFGGSTLSVKLDDEAAGAFLILEDTNGAKLSIDYEQWKILNLVVESLFAQRFEGV